MARTNGPLPVSCIDGGASVPVQRGPWQPARFARFIFGDGQSFDVGPREPVDARLLVAIAEGKPYVVDSPGGTVEGFEDARRRAEELRIKGSLLCRSDWDPFTGRNGLEVIEVARRPEGSVAVARWRSTP